MPCCNDIFQDPRTLRDQHLARQTGWPISQLKGSQNKKTWTLQCFVDVCSSTETGCNTKLAAKHLIHYSLSQHQSSVHWPQCPKHGQKLTDYSSHDLRSGKSRWKQCVTQQASQDSNAGPQILTLARIRHLWIASKMKGLVGAKRAEMCKRRRGSQT